MITTLAINNYRSIRDLNLELGGLNLVTGANGSGKSNLYRALRLLAETAQGGVINALAREGGLDSAFWAGPEQFSRAMRDGSQPVQGGPRKAVKRLRLGFSTGELGYAIALGLPEPSLSAFALDPEIKTEAVWGGALYHPNARLVERQGPMVRIRQGRQWRITSEHLSSANSLFDQLADPELAPELFHLREYIRSWRFYDHFRSDAQAPARLSQIGTRTPVLHHDGRDLCAALQTIIEVGDRQALQDTIADAFPGASLRVLRSENGYFSLEFSQPGLLRPLSGAELSDGTLRYLLWVAALLTPRPPGLMVLNEPETSLHPDLLPALARLITHAAKHTQLWVVSHANRLINALDQAPTCHRIELDKELGETQVMGVAPLERPAWRWMD